MASPPFLYLGGRANSTTPGCRSSSTTRSIRPTWKPQSPPVSVRLIVEIKKNRPILTGGFLFLRSAIRRCQIAATTTPHGGAGPRQRAPQPTAGPERGWSARVQVAERGMAPALPTAGASLCAVRLIRADHIRRLLVRFVFF